jgi:hypothetical protein
VALGDVLSERDVVVEVRLRRERVAASGPGVVIALAAEHAQARGDDLGGIAVLTVVGQPLAGLQAALQIHQRALLQVLSGDLRDLAEQSGRDNALLRRPPLRTVLATFTAHGSSLE